MKDYALKINGHNYDVRIDDVNESSTLAHVVVNGTAYEVEIAGAKGAATNRPQVVKVGDTIATGQTLVILEAMKMENNIDADRAGVVKQIFVQQGATVMEGDNLILIE